MVVVIGALAMLGAIAFWILRARNAVSAVRELDHDTRGMRRRIRHAIQDFRAGSLRRINDPRLAATILMIQIVRAEGHMTADEKTRILSLMETKLGLSPPQPIFEKAWAATQANRPFSLFCDDLLPLLRDRLTPEERDDLIDMLHGVSGADTPATELQGEAVTRLRKRLRA
jgi:uncharacterized tellurite resistance protein B-like protein